MRQNDPLIRLITNPTLSASISLSDWNSCIHRLRRARLAGRLYFQLSERGLLSTIPDRALNHLQSGKAVGEEHARAMRWELSRLENLAENLPGPVVLLKGAAYVLADLPPAMGRLYADLDIMVPRHVLAAVERTFVENGWEQVNLDAYDQRYYRTWMHELPPLRHKDRQTVIDVHHNILPTTSRLKPKPELLFEAARHIEGSRFSVLAPADMLLHSAAHMFQDGDLAGSLRDLLDMDDLLRHFGAKEEGFWDSLVPRARQLDLARPLFYALRYAKEIFETPIPESVMAEADEDGPPAPVRRVMDWMVKRVLLSESGEGGFAGFALYVRSHWLRMPPLLLARHLTRKALRRFFPRPSAK